MNALGADVVGEDFAELIFCDIAEIGSLAAEVRHARRRVAGAAAGSFERRSHARIQEFGALGIDEVHRRLGDLVINEELVVAPGNDIHDGVADCQNIESCHEMGSPEFVISGVRS